RAYVWAKEMLARSNQVRRAIEELSLGTGGSVVVAASIAVGSYLVPPLLSRLRQERTGADITVHAIPAEQALHLVEVGEADLAVLNWHDRLRSPLLHFEKLRDEPLVLCTSPRSKFTQDSIGIAELSTLPLVGVPRDVAYQRVVEAQLRDLGVGDLNVVIRLGHAEAIKQAVLDHGWLSLIPYYCVAEDLATGRLRRVEISDAAIHEPIGLFYRHDTHFSPLQQAALDAIREGASR
ncbi:MAG: substrate-binding domain-containing protein, partial [Thermomicrobiales bacterium]